MKSYKRIKGFPNYGVAKCGTVANLVTQKEIKPQLKKSGYIHIKLFNSKGAMFFLLHRVVYEAWVGIPNGFVVDHQDDDKSNCALSNLLAMSQKDNINRKFRNMPCPKIVNQVGRVLQVTRPINEFCAKYSFKESNLNQVMLGNRKTCQGWRVVE